MTIAELFEDVDYQKIREKLNSPNIFTCLDNASYEIRHSNFIAWLLNPGETHNQKDYFLRQFLSAIGEPPPSEGEHFDVRRERWKIDIVISTQARVLAIENKIFAKDSVGQLAKYRAIIARKFPDKRARLIYWTLDRESPIDGTEDAHWYRFSHREFNQILMLTLKNLKDQRVAFYVEDYIDAVSLTLLGNTSFSEDAKKLVAKHKGVLKKIFEGAEEFGLGDQKAINFLKQNSSFVKGIGFFSREGRFRDAFSSACKKNDYFVFPVGPKQTTYFSFCPNDIIYKLPEKERCFGFQFRFFEKKKALELSFGLGPETAANIGLRGHIYKRIGKIHDLPGVQAVNRPGKIHTGIAKKTIRFDAFDIDASSANAVVAELFRCEVQQFVSPIAQAMKDILIE